MTASIATVAGLEPVVQLGAFTSGIPTGEARWAVATWSTPGVEWVTGSGYVDPIWTDITCDVNAVEINTGRDRSIDRWQVGNATITLNNASGWADIGPPSTDPLAFEVRPGRQIRFGVAVDGAVPRWLYRWFIDSVEPSYEPAQDTDVVTVACVDAKGQVGKTAAAKTATPVGAGDTADARIALVLDTVRWAPGARNLEPSTVTLQATEFGTQVVDVMDRAADSSGGVVYGDVTGRIAYRSGDWQLWLEDNPPDAAIGNGPDDSTNVLEAGNQVTWFGDNVIFGIPIDPDVCPVTWELSFELADVATQVHAGRQGQPPQVFDDLPNQVRYGVETFTRTDLECVADAQITAIGQQLLAALSAEYMPNVAAVTLDAATSTPARDLCVTVDPTIPSRYRCRLHRAGGRIVFDRQFFAVGVQHRIDPAGWETRIALDDAGPYMLAAALPSAGWDSGGWDVNAWN